MSEPNHPQNPVPSAPGRDLLRAAEYVRMSTEHQLYSTHNQSDKIRTYAEQRGIEIVRTYADEGKSGLSIGGRAALQRAALSSDATGIGKQQASAIRCRRRSHGWRAPAAPLGGRHSRQSNLISVESAKVD